MRLLVLLVLKRNNFLLKTGILHGYVMVTRWLLIHVLLHFFDAAFHEVPN